MGHHHSKPKPWPCDGTPLSVGSNCSKRSLTTEEHDLDTTVLLPTKIVFYALAISLVLLMIGHQISKYRSKKKQAITMTAGQGHFADEDVEKGHFGETTTTHSLKL